MKAKVTDPEKQIAGFIAEFEPRHQALIRAVRKCMRSRFPTAYELIYDNYNFLVFGYGPTERPSDCIVSVAAAANGVGLCFIQGAKLPDPKKVLLGSGKQTRFVRLDSAATLKRPEVDELLTSASELAKTPFPTDGDGKTVVRSISAKRRPRRKS